MVDSSGRAPSDDGYYVTTISEKAVQSDTTHCIKKTDTTHCIKTDIYNSLNEENRHLQLIA